MPALAITPSTIDEAAIAAGITAKIPVYPCMAAGDALDIGISLIRLLVLASAQVGSPVSCPLSSDQARDLFRSNGSAELAYDVSSASGKPYSSTPSASITVTVDLSAPGDVDPPTPEDDVMGPLTWEHVVSLATTSNCFAALRADGTVAFANPELVVDIVPGLEKVISLVAGYKTIAALQAGGTVVLLESDGDELSMLDCGAQVRNVIVLCAVFDTFYAQTSDGEILVFGAPGRTACPPPVVLGRMQRKFSFYK